MSAEYHARVQQTHYDRFGRFLVTWLKTLPPDGWKGTATELSDVLDEFAVGRPEFRHTIVVPRGSGLTKTLEAHRTGTYGAGFALQIGRTKAGRFLSFIKREAK